MKGSRVFEHSKKTGEVSRSLPLLFELEPLSVSLIELLSGSCLDRC